MDLENMIKVCRINASVSDRDLVQRFCENGVILIDSAGLSMEQERALHRWVSDKAESLPHTI